MVTDAPRRESVQKPRKRRRILATEPHSHRSIAAGCRAMIAHLLTPRELKILQLYDDDQQRLPSRVVGPPRRRCEWRSGGRHSKANDGIFVRPGHVASLH
jgi:hypothetical protein